MTLDTPDAGPAPSPAAERMRRYRKRRREARRRQFQPPEICLHLWVFGDNDPGYRGQASAYVLARRQSSQRKVEVEIPPKPCKDWNDVLMARKGVG